MRLSLEKSKTPTGSTNWMPDVSTITVVSFKRYKVMELSCFKTINSTCKQNTNNSDYFVSNNRRRYWRGNWFLDLSIISRAVDIKKILSLLYRLVLKIKHTSACCNQSHYSRLSPITMRWKFLRCTHIIKAES